MAQPLYRLTRNCHLYAGLFARPFLLVFALSVFYLAHPPASEPAQPGPRRVVENLSIPVGVEALPGRARVDEVRTLLEQAGVRGEIGSIRYNAGEHRLIIPAMAPGRETTLAIDLAARRAEITEQQTGLFSALVFLHKAPGPHLADIRANWLPLLAWRGLADAIVYLMLFLTASGVYLWTALRSERRVGLIMLAAGAASLAGVACALAG